MKKTIPSRHKGFTVVELLVVIIVIGLLATITYVGYKGVRESGMAQQAQSNAAVLRQKIEAYKSVVGNYPLDTSVSAYTASLNSHNESSIASSNLTIIPNTPTATTPTTSVEVLQCNAPAEVVDASAYEIIYFDYGRNAPTTTPLSGDLDPNMNCSSWTPLTNS